MKFDSLQKFNQAFTVALPWPWSPVMGDANHNDLQHAFAEFANFKADFAAAAFASTGLRLYNAKGLSPEKNSSPSTSATPT